MAAEAVGVDELSHRELAILRAVAAGRAEIVPGSEPDLTIDGCWCDYVAAHRLAHTGLIRPTVPGPAGRSVPAEVTVAGRRVLESSAGRSLPALPVTVRGAA